VQQRDEITRSAPIALSDYISNVAIIAEMSDTTAEPCAIVLDNVLSDGNFDLTFGDKEEGVIPVTFTAHFDPDDLDTEPYHIYYPTEA
jgi:hypothetical protein